PPGRAAGALAVKAASGAVVRLALLALLAPVCPGLLRLPRVSPLVVAAVLTAAGLAAVLLATPWWTRCRRALAAVLADIRALHARPARAAALWGGSVAFAALHALVLIAVTRAVGLPLAPL
ncbi:TIGR00374 family protein, partial [Streptomyces sp. SID2955]|nr:TIGR00374 family protein [Streptomyces sp. SID2955]